MFVSILYTLYLSELRFSYLKFEIPFSKSREHVSVQIEDPTAELDYSEGPETELSSEDRPSR